MSAPDRELCVSDVVQAPPAVVWQLLIDFSRMSQWSPETVAMVPLKPGGLRLGQWYLGLNRRKAFGWPTRNVVIALDAEKQLGWHTTSSGAQWFWELEPAGEGTRVTHRRPMPTGATLASKVIAPIFLGGSGGHADELEAGMAATLAGLKRAAEG